MDWTTLTGARNANGSIKNWGKHALIDAESVLTEAQAWIYQHLRTREMMVVDAEVSISDSDDSFTLPAGFQEIVSVQLHGDRAPLVYKQEHLLDRSRDESGFMVTRPIRAFTILGNLMLFDCESDDGRTGVMTYFGTPAPLTEGNPTNFLCTKYPSLLRTVCTAYAYEDRENWSSAERMFKRAIGEVETANFNAEGYRRGQMLRE